MMPKYLLPLSYALLLHLLIASALLWSWDVVKPDEFKIPEHIQATLVVLEKPKPAPVPDTKAIERRRQQELARQKAAQEQVAKEQAAREAKAREEEARKALEELQNQQQLEQAALEKAAQDAERRRQEEIELVRQADEDRRLKEQQELERIRQEQEREALERELAEQSLLDSLELDDEAQQQIEQQLAEDEKVANSYFALIKEQIEINWSKPPSATSGMTVGLEMHLLPTGELKDVFIIQSSGDVALDRSAERAVRKVRRFQVPSDSRVFEKYFRTFSFGFQPEDLRL